MRGAVAPPRPELELQLLGGVALHSVVRRRQAGDVVAQLLAVVCFAAQRRVQAEAVDVGAQGLSRCSLARYCTPEGQQLVPGAGPKAMRYVMAAACSGRRVRASSPSTSGSARLID